MAQMVPAVGAAAARSAAAAAVAKITDAAVDARNEAINEPNEHLRKEKENLVDNVLSGAKIFDKATNLGFNSYDVLANDNVDASVSHKLNEIMNDAMFIAKESINNVARNIDRCNEIEPGSIQFDVPNSIEYYNNDNNSNNNNNSNNENENENEDIDSKMAIIGEKDYLSDDSKYDSNDENTENNRNSNEIDNENGGYLVSQRKEEFEQRQRRNRNVRNVRNSAKKAQKNAKNRKIVQGQNNLLANNGNNNNFESDSDEGQIRKTPKYSKIVVLLSAFFYAGFVVLRQLKKGH